MKNSLKELLSKNENLQKLMSTEQYKKSLMIIKEKIRLGYNHKDMASALGLSLPQYAKMELGDPEISISEFDNVISKLKELSKNTHFFDNKFVYHFNLIGDISLDSACDLVNYKTDQKEAFKIEFNQKLDELNLEKFNSYRKSGIICVDVPERKNENLSKLKESASKYEFSLSDLTSMNIKEVGMAF